MTLALATPALAHPSELGWLAALVDLQELERRGWDAVSGRFVPDPADALFGYARCPVRGCENVTEYTAKALCTRCQHRYGRWLRQHDGAGLDAFLAAVTQTRAEDVERMCLVCRTPGHERPAHSAGLCDSCLVVSKRRGQSAIAYAPGRRAPSAGATALDVRALRA